MIAQSKHGLFKDKYQVRQAKVNCFDINDFFSIENIYRQQMSSLCSGIIIDQEDYVSEGYLTVCHW